MAVLRILREKALLVNARVIPILLLAVASLAPLPVFSQGIDDHRACISQLNSAYAILGTIEGQGAALKSSKKVGAGTMALAYSKQLSAESAMKAYIDQLSEACSELR